MKKLQITIQIFNLLTWDNRTKANQLKRIQIQMLTCRVTLKWINQIQGTKITLWCLFLKMIQINENRKLEEKILEPLKKLKVMVRCLKLKFEWMLRTWLKLKKRKRKMLKSKHLRLAYGLPPICQTKRKQMDLLYPNDQMTLQYFKESSSTLWVFKEESPQIWEQKHLI